MESETRVSLLTTKLTFRSIHSDNQRCVGVYQVDCDRSSDCDNTSVKRKSFFVRQGQGLAPFTLLTQGS